MSMPRHSPIANFFCGNLAGPNPAPQTALFVVRSDELLNSKYGRSATGAERPILIPSTRCLPGVSCHVPGTKHNLFFTAYRCLQMFSRGGLWATDEQARDLSDVWKTATRTETKGLHYLRVNIDRVKAFSCQSDHRSASRSHGPFIIRYFDVFGSVSVLDNISFFQVPWGLLTMRW